jgi:phenylacetate-CoA ligase
MSLQMQFDETQWWTPDELRTAQFEQLSKLADHAAQTVPFYARRLEDAGFISGMTIDEEFWSRLPILTRGDLRDLGSSLHSSKIFPAFEPLGMASSSGSTGIPVRVRKSAIDKLMWDANYIREERWHCEDVSGTYAIIKAFSGVTFSSEPAAAAVLSPEGLIQPDWGHPASLIWKTGKSGLLHSSLSVPEKVNFLRKLQPNYLLTSPSSLRLILGYMRDNGIDLPSLRSVRTASERLDDDLRELCRDILGCRIVHNYSSNETGYIAVQCPDSLNYHIMSETVFCEVLDESGRPCRLGEIGRVVVTPLQNFVMPLLRYEIGDEAEVGEPCSCGRGLPVLKNVVGRLQEYLTLKSGERRRVTYNSYRLSSIPAILEYQLAQISLGEIELRLVVSRDLSAAELENVTSILTSAFGDAFAVHLRFCASLPRTAAGKLRPFVSELAAST